MDNDKKNQSILLVDDDEDILNLLYYTFYKNYNVFRANNAKDALTILSGNHIDLIISDQRMPETTGVEFFAQVNELYPRAGKVLLTGYADLQAIVEAINQGSVDKYITKPWSHDQITKIVLEVLNSQFRKSIEERKRIEAQLVQSAKMASLGEMIAGIAHEINNPLSFIHANLGNLSKFIKKVLDLVEIYDKLDISADVKEKINKAKEDINYEYLKSRITEMIEISLIGGDRMKKIIMDIKTFSRLDAAEFAESDIHSAIDITLNILTHEYNDRIVVKKEYGEIPLIECYIDRINQVFMNLLVNAGHAIKDKGEVKIKTGMEDGMVKIEISDTGSGIPDDIIDKIFDPFFTTKPVGSGTGLGLSISHGIIEQHKGTLSVKSKLGEGTTFTIMFPVHQTE
ncbi:MAG TPA: ATP-binding protein [Syntrophales bacterium]|nr:ATP-binding protein [Syntrophales bacterium]